MKMFDYKHITGGQVADMTDLIAAHADRGEAQRFAKLPFELRQKITVVLRSRQKRMSKLEMHIDKSIVREVIDDAKNGLFIINDDIIKHHGKQ